MALHQGAHYLELTVLIGPQGVCISPDLHDLWCKCSVAKWVLIGDIVGAMLIDAAIIGCYGRA